MGVPVAICSCIALVGGGSAHPASVRQAPQAMGKPIARRPLGTGECYEVRVDQNESSHHIRVVTNTARSGGKLVMCWARKSAKADEVSSAALK